MSNIGAYAIERDYSHYVAYADKTVLAIVGTASKGPVGEAVAVTSTQDLVNKFGPLKSECYGLYAAQYFLSQSSKMYFVRAAGESLASAKLNITGVDKSSEQIDNAIIINMLEKGSFSNGYTLTLTAHEDKYNIVLKSASGNVLESIKDLSLSDFVVGYHSQYFEITGVNIDVSDEGTILSTGTYTFSEGNDSIEDIVAGDYINAANALSVDSLDINLIAVPGVTETEVIEKVLDIAENRGDSLYVVDTPNGKNRDEVIEWLDENPSLNRSYGAIYYSWVNIYDSYNKQYVQVPPSVVVCATIAYSDRISEVWYAPAGLNRGLVRGAINTVTSLSKADVDLLYDHNINSIYESPQVGLVLWGQKTLYRGDTALNRVNVRRLFNYLKKIITAACSYLVFEPNDRITWNSFEMKVMPTLDSIKNRRGIYEYKIVKGETIVTPEDIDNYKMPCMILVRPTKAAEEIPIYFVITSSGADFNEVLEANGVVNQ